MIGKLSKLPEVVSGDFSILGQEDKRHGRDLSVSFTLLAGQVEPVLLDFSELESLGDPTSIPALWKFETRLAKSKNKDCCVRLLGFG